MMPEFHETDFDDSTHLKLAVFRGYIKEWLPTFLTDYQGKSNFPEIWIFDFFSGPGTDSSGNLGTPLIIIEEIQRYFETRQNLMDQKISINLVFNDIRQGNIVELKKRVAEKTIMGSLNIQFYYHSTSFQDLLPEYISTIASPSCPCLIILDQFGVKEVNREVFQKLVNASRTDIMFFVSSSIIKRFSNYPFIKELIPLPVDIENVEWNEIHRVVCEGFRNLAKKEKEYYVAPFSIKKGANIWGIIFGSSHPFGLEKFLKVAWKIDPNTGEANFSIDKDPEWGTNQQMLFVEMNVTRKEDVFRDELIGFLHEKMRSSDEIYIFALEKGFPPEKVNSVLKSIHNSLCFDTAAKIQRGKYRIGWNHYKNREKPGHVPVYIQIKELPNG